MITVIGNGICELTEKDVNLEYNKLYSVDPKTSQFEGLKFMKNNRIIKNRYKLKETLITEGIKTPIEVNQHLEIVNGQHRYKIAIEEGLPYQFIIKEYTNSRNYARELHEHTQKWNIADIVHSYAEDGNEDYIELNKMFNLYKDIFRYGDIIKIASGLPNLTKLTAIEAWNGDFQLYNNGIQVEQFYNFVKEVQKELNIRKIKRDFVNILFAIWGNVKFKEDEFILKLKNESLRSPNLIPLVNANSGKDNILHGYTKLINIFNKGYQKNSPNRIKGVPTLDSQYSDAKKPDYREYNPDRININYLTKQQQKTLLVVSEK